MRQQQNTSSGPMADIAFLLLIFFLVTSNISQDYCINVNISKPFAILDSLSLAQTTLLVNSNGEYLLNNRKVTFEELSEAIAQSFMQTEATKNVVLIKSSRDVDFEYYLSALNESKKSFKIHYENISKNLFGKKYYQLSNSQKQLIQKSYPVVLAEDVVRL